VNKLRGRLSDIGWLLVIVWGAPIAIALLGLPIAGAVAIVHAVLKRLL
jgi:hypothetical protein